jgi:hypothetical protein
MPTNSVQKTTAANNGGGCTTVKQWQRLLLKKIFTKLEKKTCLHKSKRQ